MPTLFQFVVILAVLFAIYLMWNHGRDKVRAHQYVIANRDRVSKALAALEPFVQADGVRERNRTGFKNLQRRMDAVMIVEKDLLDVNWLKVQSELRALEYQADNAKPVLLNEVAEAMYARDNMPWLMKDTQRILTLHEKEWGTHRNTRGSEYVYAARLEYGRAVQMYTGNELSLSTFLEISDRLEAARNPFLVRVHSTVGDGYCPSASVSSDVSCGSGDAACSAD